MARRVFAVLFWLSLLVTVPVVTFVVLAWVWLLSHVRNVDGKSYWFENVASTAEIQDHPFWQERPSAKEVNLVADTLVKQRHGVVIVDDRCRIVTEGPPPARSVRVSCGYPVRDRARVLGDLKWQLDAFMKAPPPAS